MRLLFFYLIETSTKISQGRRGTSFPEHTLEDVLQESLYSTPAVSVRTDHLVSEAAGLLPNHLESFTDSLVVTKDEKPLGLVGGFEILKGVYGDPSYRFFDKTLVEEVTNRNLLMVTANTTLAELLERWIETRRAFALIPNRYHGYSVITARKILEVGIISRIGINISEMNRKKVITFGKEDTIRDIIRSMFDNKTRKLVLEGTSQFISDRIIIQKIVRDLGFLQRVEDFLDMETGIFRLGEASIVSDELSFWQACDMMYTMNSPYLLSKDNILSPWDAVMTIASHI